MAKRRALEEDPDFDPDNVVIRGAPLDSDEEREEEDGEGEKHINGGINPASTTGAAAQQLAFSNVTHT